LVRRESSTKLPVVLPLRPRQSFGPGEGVFEVARRAVFTGTNVKTGIEVNVGRSRGDVGSDVDAKIRVVERGSLGLDIRDVIAAVRHEMKFVEQRGREDPGVLQIEKVVIRPADTG